MDVLTNAVPPVTLTLERQADLYQRGKNHLPRVFPVGAGGAQAEQSPRPASNVGAIGI